MTVSKITINAYEREVKSCKSFLEHFAKSQNSAINQFFETRNFYVRNSKLSSPECSVSSKHTSNGCKSLSITSNTSIKIQKRLFKLRQDAEKAKIFAVQIEELAKRKLELIKRKQTLKIKSDPVAKH